MIRGGPLTQPGAPLRHWKGPVTVVRRQLGLTTGPGRIEKVSREALALGEPLPGQGEGWHRLRGLAPG